MKTAIVLALTLMAAGAATVQAADAKEIYDKDCAKCHGADGKGQTAMGKKNGARDYTDAKVQAEMKDADMTKAIKDGVKKDDKVLMKAFPDYSEADIKALVAYIRAFKK